MYRTLLMLSDVGASFSCLVSLLLSASSLPLLLTLWLALASDISLQHLAGECVKWDESVRWVDKKQRTHTKRRRRRKKEDETNSSSITNTWIVNEWQRKLSSIHIHMHTHTHSHIYARLRRDGVHSQWSQGVERKRRFLGKGSVWCINIRKLFSLL